MAKARSLVGLDCTRPRSSRRCLTPRPAVATFAMTGENAGVAGFCAGLPWPVRVAYEAGPTGYGWRASSPSVAWCGWPGAEQDPPGERGSGQDRSSRR